MVCGENKREAKSKYVGKIYGFPFRQGAWCNSRLKQTVLKKFSKGTIQYLGIAFDEPDRFHNLSEIKKSPLVVAEWNEQMCRQWCEENGLLSPIYKTSTRGGAGSVIIKALGSFGF